MNKPLVSVIVSTKNSAETLDGCLKAIKEQVYPCVELVLVDNNSTDNTRQIAQKYTNKVYNKGPERTSQYNFGVKKAQGKYILIMASDMHIDKGLIKEAVQVSEQRGCQGIIIPEQQIGSGFWAKAKALERECLLGDNTIETPWFMERGVFLELGGFDENLVACEDWDLNERFRDAGYKAERIESFMYHQIGHLSLIRMLRKKYYYGTTMLLYLQKRPRDYKNKIPIFRKAYYRNWRLLLKHPMLSVGFVTLKALETLAASCGLVCGFLKKKYSNL